MGALDGAAMSKSAIAILAVTNCAPAPVAHTSVAAGHGKIISYGMKTWKKCCRPMNKH